MIVVKLEMWPRGREDRARELGRMYIANVGGDHRRGDYKAAVCRRGQHDCPWPHGLDVDPEKKRPRPTRTAIVRSYPRQAYNVWLPGEPLESVELGRFVLLDDVPANGETWFLGRCFEELRREGLVGVVSFSDPAPRSTAAGAVVFPGHVGTIYQAHNACYLGCGTRRTLRLLPDGTVFSERARQKLRRLERGWRYAVELLVRHGAPEPGDDVRAWAAEWVPRVTRPLTHPGNFKYAWTLRRRDRRHLPASRPYPKLHDTRRAA